MKAKASDFGYSTRTSSEDPIKPIVEILIACLACSGLPLSAQSSPANRTADFSRFIVIGDSLSAGVQNFSLLDTQQPHGYASLIAAQAKVSLILPLVPPPGIPNVLELLSPGPPPAIQPAPGNLPPIPRDNPYEQPTNIAVPGIFVHDALNLTPSLNPTTPTQAWATVVLGFPELLVGEAPTEVALAVSLHPTTLIDWLGNNDALVPALTGQLNQLTPPVQFAIDYGKVLDAFSGSGSAIVTATIPDVTEIPYFTSIRTIAQNAQINLGTVINSLGVGPNDFVRPSAQPFISSILSGGSKGPLPASCPSPLPDFGTPTVPCVLTAEDAQTIRERVDTYNAIITFQSAIRRAVVVDAHTLVDDISRHGYWTGSIKLTTAFLGGLFSLDGIHPTNSGYAIIANQFIETMNSNLHTQIPLVDVNAVALADPLVFQK